MELKRKSFILTRNLNLRVGIRNRGKVVRRFGEITVNDSGDKLINIWKQHDLKICNIYFEHKYVYRYTWERQAY
jgi:hypothetical protein